MFLDHRRETVPGSCYNSPSATIGRKGETMPPIARPGEYFAELLEIGKSKAPQTERLQQVELVVEQFLSELEAANVGEIEAESYRTKFVGLVSKALIDPSTGESAKLVLNHAYSLLTASGARDD